MEKNAIKEKLQAIVKPYVQDEGAFSQLTEESDLLDDLKINSANLVDIILDAEDEFGIEIDDESAEQMRKVGDAIRIIEERLEE